MFGLLTQLGNASSHNQRPDENAINFLLSVIKGAKPKDQFEVMLAAQMAAIHTATMTFARRIANVETIEHQDSAERAFNKLARTYAMQMEVLKRYRTGGLPNLALDRLSRYEATLWRQAGRILYVLETLDRRKPQERMRRFWLASDDRIEQQ